MLISPANKAMLLREFGLLILIMKIYTQRCHDVEYMISKMRTNLDLIFFFVLVMRGRKKKFYVL